MDEEKKMTSDSILFPFLCGLTLVALLTSCGPGSDMGEAPVNGSETVANPLETTVRVGYVVKLLDIWQVKLVSQLG